MKPQTLVALALISLTTLTATGEAFGQFAGGPNNPPGTTIPDNNPEPVVLDSEVCLFTGKLYSGANFCTRQKGYFKLSRYWRNRVRSMTIEHAVVQACDSADLKGECKTYSGDVDQISANLINGIKAVTIQ